MIGVRRWGVVGWGDIYSAESVKAEIFDAAMKSKMIHVTKLKSALPVTNNPTIIATARTRNGIRFELHIPPGLWCGVRVRVNNIINGRRTSTAIAIRHRM